MDFTTPISLRGTHFLEKLNDETELLDKRIDLAYEVFCTRELSFSRKEELIFIWISDCIKYRCTNLIKLNELEMLFNLLERCLSNERTSSSKFVMRNSVCEYVFEIIQLWAFNSGCSAIFAQQCFVNTLKSQLFYRSFKLNLDKKFFSNLVISYFNSELDETSVENSVFIIEQLIRLHSETLLKQDLQTQFAESILIAVVNNFINSGIVYGSEYRQSINTAIKNIMFSGGAASTLRYIDGIRNLTKIKEKHLDVYYFIELIIRSPKECSSDFVKFLYPTFLQIFASKTTDESLIFEVLVFLCHLIGVKPKEDCVSFPVKEFQELHLDCVLLEIIKVLKVISISQDAAIANVHLSHWLKGLFYVLVNRKSVLSSDVLSVTQEIMFSFNPHVIKQLFPHLVKHIMLRRKTTDVLEVYNYFLTDVFNLFVKLNRISEFVSMILVESSTVLTNNYSKLLTLDEIFPRCFLKMFVSTITLESIASCFPALAVVQLHIHKFISQNNELYFEQFSNEGFTLLTEILFEITSHLLRGITSADHRVSNTYKKQVSDVLDDLLKVLRDFGVGIISYTFNSRVTTAYLNLCHSWGYTHLMMLRYSYDDGKVYIDKQTNMQASNLSYVLEFLPDRTWGVITKTICQSEETEAKHALFNLMMQKMSVLSEMGDDEPEQTTAEFLLNNADDDWLVCHVNVLLRHLNRKCLKKLAQRLSRYDGHEKLVALLSTTEFQETESKMVTAMSFALLREIGSECSSKDSPLLESLLSNVMLDFDIDNKKSETNNSLSELASILSENLKKENVKPVHISFSIKRKLQLLSILPISHLRFYPQEAILLCMLGAARCLPYYESIYNIIAGILDIDHPIKMPDTFCWESALKWIAVSAKPYPHSAVLFSCLLKCVNSSTPVFETLVSSISSDDCELNIRLCTIIATYLEKMRKKKRVCNGNIKDLISQSCRSNLYSCIKNVVKMEPSLEWISTYRMAIQYHLAQTDYEKNVKYHEHVCKLIADYVDIIITKLEGTEKITNVEDEDVIVTYQNSYPDLEEIGQFMVVIFDHHSKLGYSFPDGFIFKPWYILSDYLPIHKLQFFVQTVDSQFENTLNEIVDLTCLLVNDQTLEKRIWFLWRVILLSNLNEKKSILRNTAVDQLSDVLLTLSYKTRISQTAMNCHSLLVTLITTLKVKMKICHIDMCLEVISATSRNATPELIQNSLNILSNILNHRMPLISDLILQFAQRFTYIANIIAAASIPEAHNATDDHFLLCSFSLEKLANLIAMSSKEFSRVSQFIMSEILSLFEQYTLTLHTKKSFQKVIYTLLPLCDSNSISYLMTDLPPASKEILKRLYDSYRKHHAYTGKC